MTTPTVKDIVREYLEAHGYDGLCSYECGCRLDDLFPCCGCGMDCVPGHKIPDPDGETDYVIADVPRHEEQDDTRNEPREPIWGIPRAELDALGEWHWPVRVRRVDGGYPVEWITTWYEPACEPRIVPEIHTTARDMVASLVEHMEDEDSPAVIRDLWRGQDLRDAAGVALEGCKACDRVEDCDDALFSRSDAELEQWCPLARLRGELAGEED
jgi:hypothetical protein